MPFRPTFDCLWCGTPHTPRSETDLEGWAQLCPTCLGKAGDNPFLRFRLRDAIEERGRHRPGAPQPVEEPRPAPAAADPPNDSPTDDALVAYYEARAPEYDDWYLRRGRYDHGPIANMAWQADLDAATTWLDDLPMTGRIVELAAGTGWWSPLLASKGELWLTDAAPAPLERATSRLVAHGLRAHVHVRDAWAEPDGGADALFAGFWLGHIPEPRLAAFLALVRRWLRPGGLFAFIDSLADPATGARDHPPVRDGIAERRLEDGRTFRIPKVIREPAALAIALEGAGFDAIDVRQTARFFVLGRAVAPAAPSAVRSSVSGPTTAE